MRKILFLVLVCSFLSAQTIAEKKANLSQKSHTHEGTVQEVNDRLVSLRAKLDECRLRASSLKEENEFQDLLTEVGDIRMEISLVEEKWRDASVGEAKREGEGYALWDQEETTLAQLVMEYGSLDYVYIVPPEMASMKLHVHSSIPVPRESWSRVLEIILMHNGIGVKKINSYAKQLYILKQDLSSIQAIATSLEDLAFLDASSRVFYLLSPPVEQVRSVFQFFERFADAKQSFVHQVGSKIAVVASKEELQKMVSLYNTVWEGHEGKVSKVVSVSKMNVKEMERVLTAFFGEAIEKGRPPFGKVEQEGLGVFSLGQSNTLVLIGSKDNVERAERIVRQTEEQLEDPAEMTIYLYTCRYTDPNDLVKVLEKVYLSLLNAPQEGPTKETDVSFGAQSPTGRVPEGYPPTPPLVVSPTPIKPGISAKLEVEQTYTDHFTADPKTGTVLMTVRRDVLPKIKELLKKLDVPKKMVYIEVLLFERKLDTQDNFGMNLLKLGSSQGVSYTPHFGPPVGAKGIMQFFFHGSKHKYTPHFDVAYNFLMTQDDIQLNASPSVITVNQTEAMITIVEEISINNGAAPIDSNQGTAFEKSFSRQQYGIIIKLTPTIHAPEEDEDKGSVTLLTDITFDSPRPHHDDRPTVDRRSIQNEVRVIDGETIILGGLRRKLQQDREEKIPFFGNIPLFGRLFGTTQLVDRETEMFFFITPKIVLDPKEEMEKTRLEELKKRPGDIPEFLQKVDEARNKENSRYFRQSMKTFFTHDR